MTPTDFVFCLSRMSENKYIQNNPWIELAISLIGICCPWKVFKTQVVFIKELDTIIDKY